MGKGSERRPTLVGDDEAQKNWERTFGATAKVSDTKCVCTAPVDTGDGLCRLCNHHIPAPWWTCEEHGTTQSPVPCCEQGTDLNAD